MFDQFKQKVVNMAKSGQRQEALQYAKQYIKQNPEDLDAWWFVANLVKNPKVKRQCCEHILEMNPFHGEAQAMLDELDRAEQVVAVPVQASPFTTDPTPPVTSPFTESPAPAQVALTNPLGMSQSQPASGVSFGLPSVDEFFDDEPGISPNNPFADKPNVDLRPLGMRIDAEMSTAKTKKSAAGMLDDDTAFMMVAVVGVVAVLLIVGLVAGYVLGWFGGDTTEEPPLELTQNASNQTFTMSYPDGWVLNQYPNERMVTTNRTTVNMDDIDPWGKFSEGLNSLYPSEAFWDFALTIEDKAQGQELFVAVMQPIPQPADYIIDNMISETKEYYEGDLFLYSIKINDKSSAITMDGSNASFREINSKMSLLGQDSTMDFYFVYLVKDDQHYLFTAMVTAPVKENWDVVAREIAESIIFGEDAVES